MDDVGVWSVESADARSEGERICAPQDITIILLSYFPDRLCYDTTYILLINARPTPHWPQVPQPDAAQAIILI